MSSTDLLSDDPARFPDDALPDWVASLEFDAIPEAITRSAKAALLDTLAVGWAGWGAAGVAPVLDYVRSGGPGGSRLWGSTDSLSPAAAALGNGLLAAALDFDIVHDGATAHSHIVIAPALLALAESLDASGRDFLVAYIGGCEMAVRLGLGVQRNPGWVLSSVFGVLAGAAACARLLGLGPDGVRAAVSIAFSRAAGSQQSLVEGAFTKRLQTAFAARDAVESALLAQCGVTGPRRPFSGRAGFEALYVGLDREKSVLRLGEDWHFSKATFKNFPSCFCNHAAIIAAQRAAHGLLSPQDIAACRVRITPFSARMVGAPFAPGQNPQVAAQFSVQYSVANALIRGGLSLQDIAVPAVLNADVLGLAQRIEVQVDPSAAACYTPATVELEMRDGTTRSARVETIPGTPEQAAAPHEWLAKARACFLSGEAALSAAQFTRLTERIQQLEAVPGMKAFLELE